MSTVNYQIGDSSHLAFPGIAYHFYIEEDGKTYWTQPLEAVTWHTGTGSPYSKELVGIFNWWAIGVCFAGENPTPLQLAAMRQVGDAVDQMLGRTLERKGHKEISVGTTECPGNLLYQWKGQVA
jgi:N-acetyl-anhydromuramyl-L-alanine amidase AmpD